MGITKSNHFLTYIQNELNVVNKDRLLSSIALNGPEWTCIGYISNILKLGKGEVFFV